MSRDDVITPIPGDYLLEVYTRITREMVSDRDGTSAKREQSRLRFMFRRGCRFEYARYEYAS